MAKAKARMRGAADSTEVDTIIQKLMTDHKDAKQLGYHVFQIAEEYYFRAEDAVGRGNKEQAQPDFQKALVIWQKSINQIGDPYHQAMATENSAVVCQYMGRDEEAIEYYQQVNDRWPDYKRRWYALSALAIHYEKQMRMNELSRKAANQKIRAVYEEIVEKYPTAPCAQVAEEWLNNN